MNNYKRKRKPVLSMWKLETLGKFLCPRFKYGVKPERCVQMYETGEKTCHKGSDCSMYPAMKKRTKCETS